MFISSSSFPYGFHSQSRRVLCWVILLIAVVSKVCAESVFEPLAPGSVKANGLWQKQMEEDSKGWCSLTDEMSRRGYWVLDRQELQKMQADGEVFAPSKFWNNTTLSKKGPEAPYYHPYRSKARVPIQGEYQAHWLDMTIRFGWAGDMPEMKALAAEAVRDIIATQDPDGYIGVVGEKEKLTGSAGRYEYFSYADTLHALLEYVEYTGDQKVLSAVRQAADLICSRIGPDSHDPAVRVQYNLRYYGTFPVTQGWFCEFATPMTKLYRITGEPKYLRFAQFALKSWVDLAQQGSWSVMKSEKNNGGRIDGHAAGWGMVLNAMADIYSVAPDEQTLTQMRRAQKMLEEQCLQPLGAPSSHFEWLAGKGPGYHTETCATYWMAWFWTKMAAITGEAHYGDLAEEAAYNALAACRSKDGRIMAYFIAPNQLQASNELRFPVRLTTECCQANGPRTLPFMVERSIMRSKDGLAVLFFESGRTEAKLADGTTVTVEVTTNYPFDDTVALKVRSQGPSRRFSLRIRVPKWCEGAAIESLDGKGQIAASTTENWIEAKADWTDRSVRVKLPMTFRTEISQDQQASLAVVKRGPLLFSLPIDYQKREYDQWGSFEASMAEGATWNLAFAGANPRFELKQDGTTTPVNSAAWTQSPVYAEVSMRKVKNWTFNPEGPDPMYGSLGVRNTAAPMPKEPLQLESAPVTVKLVPIGFTILRMSYFPIAQEK